MDKCEPKDGSCWNKEKDCKDGNLCTKDKCDPYSGQCKHDELECKDRCESCDPYSGKCEPDHKDPSCKQEGCKVKALSLDGSYCSSNRGLFGGLVGSGCGCIGCTDENDLIDGIWVHVRSGSGGMLKTKDFDSLICGCDETMNGKLCPSTRGHENQACFTGVGWVKDKSVAFRIEVVDRGSNSSTTDRDSYRTRIWIPKWNETADGLSKAACCTKKVPNIRTADVDDAASVGLGDIIIHEVDGSHMCPAPTGICPDAP
jgi:hypothetical protein